MKIFTAAQIKAWDAYTIEQEPVRSIDLMERAANACVDWLLLQFPAPGTYTIFCGPGNNGGDGLAIARLLLRTGNTVSVFILDGKRSSDFTENLDRLQLIKPGIEFIDNTDFHVIPSGTIVIDALFGSGLNRPLQGLTADMVCYINEACKTIVSIDIPSGLQCDGPSEGAIIKASHTLTFQISKLAFWMPDNATFIGKVRLLDIGLQQGFYQAEHSQFHSVDEELIGRIYKPRAQFTHKYNFGHALLFAGSKYMMGAAILCARACLRSGAGVVTVFTEDNTQTVIQSSLPEAITTAEQDLEKLVHKKTAVGIGPGLEISPASKKRLGELINSYKGQLVIDASALSLLSEELSMLSHRSSNEIVLTPHTGEFEKLFGKTANDFERMEMAMQQAQALNCYIILKGHHTLITCPDGMGFFNTTGNAGMATAGSGDVLTGMLTGLLAQGYDMKDACVLAVYLHGLAGDLAADQYSQEAMLSGDITENIGKAFRRISNFKKVD